MAASFQFELAAVRTKLIQAQAKPALARPTDLFEPTHVFSSGLQRCVQLVHALSDRPATFDQRLLEINFGQWQSQTWPQIPPDQMQAWERDPLHYVPPGGESAYQMGQRVALFAEELKQLDDSVKVLIVSHGGPIYMLVATLLDAPLSVAMNLRVDYGSVTRLDRRAGRQRLICLKH